MRFSVSIIIINGLSKICALGIFVHLRLFAPQFRKRFQSQISYIFIYVIAHKPKPNASFMKCYTNGTFVMTKKSRVQYVIECLARIRFAVICDYIRTNESLSVITVSWSLRVKPIWRSTYSVSIWNDRLLESQRHRHRWQSERKIKVWCRQIMNNTLTARFAWNDLRISKLSLTWFLFYSQLSRIS